MDVNDLYPSKWLKAGDLKGQQPTVTIADVRLEDIGSDGDRKPVVFFDGKEKGVVLNKTNATNISSAYGSNTHGWRGKQVVLFTTWVDFNGKSVEAIRMRPAQQQQFASGLPDREQSRPAPDNAGQREFAPVGDLDDEIPF